MGRALVPVEQAVATWKQFVSAREGYRALGELLADAPRAPPPRDLPRDATAVSARDLVYVAPGRDQPIIKGLSFEFGAGQVIGVIGPSGSGKSTLVRLLVGAARPTRGRLRFGGVDYQQIDPAEFGRLVGYLPQDVGLFSGSVRDNIARFGDASGEEIVAAAKRAGVHQMILDLPQQYETKLGHGGVGLSGGQRQRLGLARAVLGAPRLVVLDEPNSNLDAAGEAALRDAIGELAAQGSTVVVVTHRTTILDVVDVLLVVNGGEIDLVGRPQDVYAQLRARRVGAREEASS
ncbi:MAG TPA: ATP-binding cassette domain-containing protein, partial [Beijerinckiaceae bacterium]